MGIVGLLLLLAAVNLGTLLLSRADAQQRETGIRLALGANRIRILRLYLTESLLLAIAGSLAGLLCARWMVGFLAQMVWTGTVERIHNVPLDGRVLAFVMVAALGSGLIFGSIPALRAVKTDPIVPLRHGGATAGGSSRTGKLLVVVQVALSLVLVVSGTLFTGTLRNLKSLALGFDSSHVLGMQLINRPDGYRGIDPLAYYRDLCERLAKVPGVRSVSSSALPPVRPPFSPDQTLTAGDTAIDAQGVPVAPGFFETMQIPLVAGRDFTFRDTARTSRLAILSESLARRLSVGVDQHVNLAGRDVQIAGIVRDSRVGSLQKHSSLQVFTSTLQWESGPSQPYIVVRTAGTPTAALAQQVRAEVDSLGREYPIRTESIDRAIARALVQERLMASIAGGFGVLALMLAAIGLYGLMSYTVVRRSRDIGVRLALGADRLGIVRMVVGEALTLVAAGLAMGVPAVYAASKAASAMLQGLNPLGAAPLGIASAVLIAAALLAAILPAHRAAKLDPMAALRE